VAAPTNADWGKIHAKAWTNPKFRKLLETDPSKAVRAYGKAVGKKFTKILKLAPKPKAGRRPLELRHRRAPACC
jgi:hypothetical protein